jgi:hypothetical protein
MGWAAARVPSSLQTLHGRASCISPMLSPVNEGAFRTQLFFVLLVRSAWVATRIQSRLQLKIGLCLLGLVLPVWAVRVGKGLYSLVYGCNGQAHGYHDPEKVHFRHITAFSAGSIEGRCEKFELLFWGLLRRERPQFWTSSPSSDMDMISAGSEHWICSSPSSFAGLGSECWKYGASRDVFRTSQRQH